MWDKLFALTLKNKDTHPNNSRSLPLKMAYHNTSDSYFANLFHSEVKLNRNVIFPLVFPQCFPLFLILMRFDVI